MDRLRLLSVAFVCGFFSTPVLAQLMTIGPSTPGVSEFDVTLVQTNPGCTDGNPVNCTYFPKFTPIHPLQSGGEGIDFASMAALGAGCFAGCPLPLSLNGQPILPSDVTFEMFDVSFQTAKPVTSVTALQMGTSIGPTLGSMITAELLAFDGQQLVSACIAQLPGGCFSDTHVAGIIAGIPVAYQGNLTVSAPDITSVWIGSAPSGGLGAQGVQFRVPEPGTVSLLTLALASLGILRRRRSSRPK